MKKTSSHAQETGKVRSKRGKDRQEQSISVRPLSGGNEAKKKRQKVTVDYPRTRQAKDYKQLDLLQSRDELFDTYLNTVDRLNAWANGDVHAYFNLNERHGHREKMVKLLTKARNEISEQLIQLDDAINSTPAL